MPGIGVADVTSTTMYTPERWSRGFVLILGGEIPSEPGVFDTGGETTGDDGGWRGITEVTLSEGVLDKGVVTVSPPNNKQATLTLICLFCPSLYLALSRHFATISLSFPLPFVGRRSLSLLPSPSLSSSSFYLHLVWLPVCPRKCFGYATFRKLLTNHEELNGYTIFRILHYYSHFDQIIQDIEISK